MCIRSLATGMSSNTAKVRQTNRHIEEIKTVSNINTQTKRMLVSVTMWTVVISCALHTSIVCNFQILSVHTVKFAPSEIESSN